MVYEKKTWAHRETINTDELQHIEDGVVDAHILLANVQSELNALPDFNTFMVKFVYDPDEDGKVESGDVADSLKDNGGTAKTYADIKTEIDTDITTHSSDVSAHHVRYSDDEARVAINTDTDHGTTAPHNYRTDEEIRNVTVAMLTAGNGITVTNDDTANTLTVALTDNTFTQIDKTKLDGIEVGATADQNGDEIIVAINSSNSKIETDNLTLPDEAFTPAYQAKLDGIEVGATADQSGSEIVTAINGSTAVINAANIDRGNLATIIERGFIGEVVVGDVIRIYNPRAGVIQSVKLISGTRPISTSLLVDVRKNGVDSTNSIFNSDNPMILTTGATVSNGVFAVNGILDPTQVNLVAGDVLRVYVNQTGNASDVSVCFEILY
jgi:hypothetical protein